MDTSKFLTATLAGAIVMFVTGFLIYGLLLPAMGLPAPDSNCTRAEPMMWAIILQEIMFGGILAFIYMKWAGIKTFSKGAKTGAVLGIAFGILIASMFYGAVTAYKPLIFALGPVTLLIRMGLAGGVIGWLLGRNSE